MKRFLAIDTDPGVDDALAIMLAASDPETEIRCITAVSGNVLLGHTLENALYLKELLRLDKTRVAGGADRPLLQPFGRISSVHGEDGFAGLSHRTAVKADKETACDVIYEEAVSCNGQLELLTIGPLTNIAAAFLRHPDLPAMLKSVTMMAGSLTVGNVTPVAEFNVWVDPDACELVFRSGVPVFMCGLDGLNSSKLVAEELESLMGFHGAVNEILAMPLIRFLYDNRKGWEDVVPGIVIYDLATCACLLHPEIAEYRSCYLRCETKSPLNFGRTVADLRGREGKEDNAKILVSLQKTAYVNIIKNMLHYYQK